MSDTKFRSERYQHLLQKFGKSLSVISIGGQNMDSMIDSQDACYSLPVVCFDDYAIWVVEKKLNKIWGKNGVKSCDALFQKNDTQWFLIEFKSGRIFKRDVHEIRGKVFESLLLLADELHTTIQFTRENMHFVLVYDETKSHDPRIYIRDIKKHLARKACIPFCPFNLSKLKGVYFQDVFVVTPKELNTLVAP